MKFNGIELTSHLQVAALELKNTTVEFENSQMSTGYKK